MTMKPMTIYTTYQELDRISASLIMSSEAREAARRAAELLCAMRSALDLSWDHSAKDLYRIGCNVKRCIDVVPEAEL